MLWARERSRHELGARRAIQTHVVGSGVVQSNGCGPNMDVVMHLYGGTLRELTKLRLTVDFMVSGTLDDRGKVKA